MKVSVVIPTTEWTKDYCELAVASLRASVDWDINVVSNGSETPYDLNVAARRLHTKDQGQCIATNIGAQMIAPDADYIMVANDDMYFAPGWDENLRFEHPVFSPNLIEPTTNNGSAPPFLKEDAGYTLETFNQDRVDARVAREVGENKGSETTGFNLPFFIRKDVWQTIGGYDVRYDPWGSNSDTDLQTLIELAGIQPMRLRDVLVYHFSNKSGTFDGTHQDSWQSNWDYYTTKWGFNRDDEPVPDTWMALGLVNHEKNKFHPSWEGKYAEAGS